MNFQDLYVKVTNNDHKLTENIENVILKCWKKGKSATKYFNPDENNSQWPTYIINDLRDAGFYVDEHVYCTEYSYFIEWTK